MGRISKSELANKGKDSPSLFLFDGNISSRDCDEEIYEEVRLFVVNSGKAKFESDAEINNSFI